MENSGIAWTDHTFNPWRGCTKVSEGCAHCYAETLSARNHAVLGVWGPSGTRVTASDSAWREPEKWNRSAGRVGTRARVFCASLADVFEGPETMPENHGQHGGVTATWIDQWMPWLGNSVIATARNRLFHLINHTPHLDWLLLTKRPENVMPMYGSWLHWRTRFPMADDVGEFEQTPPPSPTWPPTFPANVWVGTTAENQERADQRIPVLLQVPARVRFVSVEPQLGPVDLRRWLDRNGVNWVISGGESGSGARPYDTNWARMLRDMCGDAGVPFFMKQTGANVIQLSVKGKGDTMGDLPEDLRVREVPT